MRATRIALSTLLLLAVLAGGALAGTDPHREQERLTAVDMALAKRTVLQRSDVDPSWRRTPVGPQDEAPLRCPGYDPDFSSFTITGKAIVAFAHQTGSSILSTVDVFKSRAQAVADFRVGAKPAVASCFRSLLNREFGKSGVPVEIVSSRSVRAPGVGERSAAYRLKAEVTAGATDVPLTMDMLVFQRGRSIAVLFFTGVFKPVAGQTELARAVAGRMR